MRDTHTFTQQAVFALMLAIALVMLATGNFCDGISMIAAAFGFYRLT